MQVHIFSLLIPKKKRKGKALPSWSVIRRGHFHAMRKDLSETQKIMLFPLLCVTQCSACGRILRLPFIPLSANSFIHSLTFMSYALNKCLLNTRHCEDAEDTKMKTTHPLQSLEVPVQLEEADQ